MAKVLIAGGTGLIGNRLSALLEKEGHEVMLLSRSKNKKSRYEVFQWDILQGIIEEQAILKADYVINLAGAGIADKPWTKSRKR
jgi:NAD dependent epimerase/dehydratase family enzyme